MYTCSDINTKHDANVKRKENRRDRFPEGIFAWSLKKKSKELFRFSLQSIIQRLICSVTLPKKLWCGLFSLCEVSKQQQRALFSSCLVTSNNRSKFFYSDQLSKCKPHRKKSATRLTCKHCYLIFESVPVVGRLEPSAQRNIYFTFKDIVVCKSERKVNVFHETER